MTFIWGLLIAGLATSAFIWTVIGFAQLIVWIGEKYWLSR